MAYHVKKAVSSEDVKNRISRVRAAVSEIISEIDRRGDEAVREYARKFDNMNRYDFRLGKDEIKAAINSLSSQEREDIEFAKEQVGTFAKAQLSSMKELEVETFPGVILGHKHLPIANVGCYIPGGQYPLLASAHMTVLTAKVAGCGRIVSCAPPENGLPSQRIVATQAIDGADEIYCLGGVQAMAAMALGTETIASVDMLAGPGNAFVTEAKRQLFGKVGVDLIAGPTEVLLIADDIVDGELCATDLLGQAEHGVNSPAVMLTTSHQLALDTLAQIDRILCKLPTAEIAGVAFRDFGEIIVCDDEAEMLDLANEIASEHVHVMTKDEGYFEDGLVNYGALFLGQRTCVAFGDKVIGTNHTLPTGQSARFTGGLWVGKFLKTVTFQRIVDDHASVEMGARCSRLCQMEGFIGHSEQANLRVRRFGDRDVPYGKGA